MSVLWQGANGDSLHREGSQEVFRAGGHESRRTILPDGRVLLSEDAWGRTTKLRPGVLTPDNPLIFYCAFCRKESTTAEPAHHRGCRHPYADVPFVPVKGARPLSAFQGQYQTDGNTARSPSDPNTGGLSECLSSST